MDVELPLPTLLSATLVAFTIELDNEFEQRMPHRTARGPAFAERRGPWLVSLVMWSNLLRFVTDDGVTVRSLSDQGANLAGMERWGYVSVAADPTHILAQPPRRDWLVRPTRAGRRAAEIWRELPQLIEERWETAAALRAALQPLVARLDRELPEYLPVLRYGLWTVVPERVAPGPEHPDDLSVLLSRALTAFTLEFEEQSEVSLPIAADVLRVLEGGALRVRDLPRRSGVSKEATSMALGHLERTGFVTVEPDPTAARAKLAQLTAEGRAACADYHRRRALIEERWRARFGEATIDRLRAVLAPLVADATLARSPLAHRLEPHAGGWRASTPRPTTLPHHPMVLHRGGYPDGS